MVVRLPSPIINSESRSTAAALEISSRPPRRFTAAILGTLGSVDAYLSLVVPVHSPFIQNKDTL